MAAFVVDVAASDPEVPFGPEDFIAGPPVGETIFVDAPSIIEAVEKVLAAKPGADIVAVSKGRPGTLILG